MTKPVKIKNNSEYNEVMATINGLMAKGSKGVSKTELGAIRSLATLAQEYEQNKFTIEPPTTLAGLIEMKMFELKMKQKDLAHKLNISNAKLSLIMNGKQKPDVEFLKSLHQELGVDGNYLLSVL